MIHKSQNKSSLFLLEATKINGKRKKKNQKQTVSQAVEKVAAQKINPGKVGVLGRGF